jgi:hypothetical protein
MTLFELIEFLLIFSDHPWVVYLWHDFIVPLMKRIGMMPAREPCLETDIRR